MILTLTKGIVTGIWAQAKTDDSYERIQRLDRKILFTEIGLFLVTVSWILLTRE